MAEPFRVPAFAGVHALSIQEWRDLETAAAAIGTRPECLANVIAKESGFKLGAKNPKSSATGYLQWTKTTAKALGVSTAEIARMTPTEQLGLAVRTYRMRNIPMAFDLEDCGQLGLANFLQFEVNPNGTAKLPLRMTLGMGDEEVLSRKGERVYDANAGLDRSKDGTITVGEVREHYRAMPSGTVVLTEHGTKTTAETDAAAIQDVLLPVLLALGAAYAIAKATR